MIPNWTYAMLPRRVMSDAGLSPCAKLVYGVYLLDVDENGVATLSAAKVAEASGLSVHQVRRAARELHEAGLMEPIDRHNGHGGGFWLAVDRNNTERRRIEGLSAGAQGTTHLRLEGLSADAQGTAQECVEGLSAGATPPWTPHKEEIQERENTTTNSREAADSVQVQREAEDARNMADLEAFLESERQDVACHWASWLNGLRYQYPVSWLLHVVQIAFVEKAAKRAKKQQMTPQSYAVSILQRWVGDTARKGLPVDREDLFDQKPWIDDAIRKSDLAASRDAERAQASTPSPPEIEFTDADARAYEEKLRKQTDALLNGRRVG